MVNLYQDHNITKDLIKNKKLDYCRLEFAIYIKAVHDQFERASGRTYSDLIQESTPFFCFASTISYFLYHSS